jgi:antitoxin (DNA-binding transcriptional repressor) of toxin-antitoxin stability system
VARLSPFQKASDERQFGRDAGLFEVPEDFDESLPDELLAAFER